MIVYFAEKSRINNKVKSTLHSAPALYYKFYHQMNYELISLTEINPKNNKQKIS